MCTKQPTMVNSMIDHWFKYPLYNIAFDIYLSLFYCCPLTLGHSCWVTHWSGNQPNAPRRRKPHWCKESKQSRGQSCGDLPYWDDSAGSSHSASRLSHPPVSSKYNTRNVSYYQITKFESIINKDTSISNLLRREADWRSVWRGWRSGFTAGDITGAEYLFTFAPAAAAGWR